jgi:hypothetical protein
LTPPPGQEYALFAYLLNRDIVNEDGSLNPLRGLIFPLGSFPSEKKAKKRAHEIFEETGITAVVKTRYAAPTRITSDVDLSGTQTIISVPVGENGKVIKEITDADFTAATKKYEASQALQKELDEEAILEEDPDHPEHFRKVAYAAVRSSQRVQALEQELALLRSLHERNLKNFKTHYGNHPEHENTWLPALASKLRVRGETDLYDEIATYYNTHRDDFIN